MCPIFGVHTTDRIVQRSLHRSQRIKPIIQGASVGADKRSSKPNKGQISRDNGGRQTLISEPVKGILCSLCIVALLRSDSEPAN